jgi:hypothetical protein
VLLDYGIEELETCPLIYLTVYSTLLFAELYYDTTRSLRSSPSKFKARKIIDGVVANYVYRE